MLVTPDGSRQFCSTHGYSSTMAKSDSGILYYLIISIHSPFHSPFRGIWFMQNAFYLLRIVVVRLAFLLMETLRLVSELYNEKFQHFVVDCLQCHVRNVVICSVTLKTWFARYWPATWTSAVFMGREGHTGRQQCACNPSFVFFFSRNTQWQHGKLTMHNQLLILLFTYFP